MFIQKINIPRLLEKYGSFRFLSVEDLQHRKPSTPYSVWPDHLSSGEEASATGQVRSKERIRTGLQELNFS